MYFWRFWYFFGLMELRELSLLRVVTSITGIMYRYWRGGVDTFSVKIYHQKYFTRL
ncbi:hypothetical protein BCEN4_1230035 [Burkholderia cenocepacia]|nr:hypothetical protein BCEN4_1230035 [Burkholderia cenocepacia]